MYLTEHCVQVPYSAAGERVRAGEAGTVLDLSPGQEVVTRDGRAGRVLRYCSTQSAWQLDIQGSSLLLGWWWMSQVRCINYFIEFMYVF